MNDVKFCKWYRINSRFQERMAHLGRKELDEGLIRPQLPLCPRSAGHCTLLSRHIEFHTNTQIHTLKNTRKRINTKHKQTHAQTHINTHIHIKTCTHLHTPIITNTYMIIDYSHICKVHTHSLSMLYAGI